MPSVGLASLFLGRWWARRDKAREANATAEATLAQVETKRIEALFTEHAQLRSQYLADNADMRQQIAALTLALSDAKSNAAVQEHRIASLELELAEWKGGLRGLPGVWVAVPTGIWQTIREGRLPTLPAAPLPGEEFPGVYTREQLHEPEGSP